MQASGGLTIPAVGAHIAMVGADPARREAAIAFVNGCTDIAVDVGAPVIHILSGPTRRRRRPVDAAWGWFRSRGRRDDRATPSTRNVTLGIEAIAGHVFHSVDDYHRLRRELPGVPFKVNFDPSHLRSRARTRCAWSSTSSATRSSTSTSRTVRAASRISSFRRSDRAAIDFPALVDALRAAGYIGALSVEYEAQVYGYRQSEADILRQGKAFYDTLRRAS